MSPTNRIVLFASFFLIFFSWPLPGQVQETVDAYFAAEREEAAEELLLKILSQTEGKEAELLKAIKAETVPLKEKQNVLIPYGNQLLQATIQVPFGHDRSKQAIPVVLDISGGHNFPWLELKGVITVFVAGFTPPEFTDQGRDGFLKILNYAAHFANGDPQRLWLTGFSWAAHASYDTALHRPGQVRGIISLGGGPRRVHFRLLPNLRSIRVLACCGLKDDKELIWNLREVAFLTKKHKLNYELHLDESKGHSLPLKGMDRGKKVVLETKVLSLPQSGKFFVDRVNVATRFIRVDKVNKKKVRVSKRIPVSASASPDAQRRQVLRVMNKKVAFCSWKILAKKTATQIIVKGKAVEGVTVFLRDDRFRLGEKVRVIGPGMRTSLTIRLDRRLALTEARRTGDRLAVVLQEVRSAKK